jgi:glycosyltransferase involved in cell wall biosynthesis
MKRKKIMLIAQPGRGGVEKVVRSAILMHQELGWEISLIMTAPDARFLASLPSSIRVHVLFREERKRISIACLVSSLSRAFDRLQPDLVCSHLCLINFVVPLALERSGSSASSVLVEHLPFFSSEAKNSRSYEPLRAFSYRKASRIVGVSKDLSRNIEKTLGWRTGSVATIHNPVVQDFSDAGLLSRTAGGGIPVILAMGRLVPQKDFTTLIRSFAHVRKSRAAKLTILGEGPERRTLEDLCESLGLAPDVSFEGYVDRPLPYIQQSSVVVCSSVFEALPTVVIEGLAAGKQIVSTDCPFGPREILQDGKLGRLVPTGDPRSLGRGILAALVDPVDPARLIRRSRDFTEERARKKYATLLKGLTS